MNRFLAVGLMIAAVPASAKHVEQLEVLGFSPAGDRFAWYTHYVHGVTGQRHASVRVQLVDDQSVKFTDGLVLPPGPGGSAEALAALKKKVGAQLGSDWGAGSERYGKGTLTKTTWSIDEGKYELTVDEKPRFDPTAAPEDAAPRWVVVQVKVGRARKVLLSRPLGEESKYNLASVLEGPGGRYAVVLKYSFPDVDGDSRYFRVLTSQRWSTDDEDGYSTATVGFCAEQKRLVASGLAAKSCEPGARKTRVTTVFDLGGGLVTGDAAQDAERCTLTPLTPVANRKETAKDDADVPGPSLAWFAGPTRLAVASIDQTANSIDRPVCFYSLNAYLAQASDHAGPWARGAAALAGKDAARAKEALSAALAVAPDSIAANLKMALALAAAGAPLADGQRYLAKVLERDGARTRGLLTTAPELLAWRADPGWAALLGK